MIGKINSFFTKVVETVKGPLHRWGPKPNTRNTKKTVPSKASAKKCKCSKKCKSC